METVFVMGMEFPKESQPDFGSIRLSEKDCFGKNEYLLKSADAAKLNMITNASDGATAYCTDTGELYLLYLNKWERVGK